MKRMMEGFRMEFKAFTGVLVAAMLLTGCDSTPRERQEVARKGARELDTLARTAAQKVANVGKATARYDASNRARRSRPLDPRQELAMETKLMGPYSGQINALTPADLPNAYAQFVGAVRTQRATWTDRDWDYARAVYQRLNDQLKQVRMDMPARYELAIRARQAEFVTLQAGHTAKGISAESKQAAQAR
ncbi:hypothetical protein Q3A66_01030 [Hymenobacter sp. BT770]|uniref:hypothetical protein n=1 Tax=Hymenobacter sp. BT770 TaxID=2886942 RepID=UPI001D11DA93|nr:hypothetical protein [Hymenobacter sp. BT770]MCC3151745.1 hypothetical protein [Hymenobacter sp. BT770]MDO3413633.1 hypothetical protein [Hymenobacter sp. BT770]